MIRVMRKEYASLRRRPLLAPVWILSALGLVALGSAAWAVHVATTTVVFVIRHAEKAKDGGLDPPLTEAGVARAARVAELLGGGGRETAIDVVFVTQFQRSAATARPLTVARAIPVITVPADDVAGLARRIEDEFRGRRVLVVAHSDTIPAIVAALAQGTSVPPIADDEYGTAYVVAAPRWGRSNVLRLTLP
jgi:phosphohistidine phosphatase SixA